MPVAVAVAVAVVVVVVVVVAAADDRAGLASKRMQVRQK